MTPPMRVPTHCRVTSAPKVIVSLPVAPDGSPGPRTCDEQKPYGYVARRPRPWITVLTGSRAARWPGGVGTGALHPARRPHHPAGVQSTAAGSACAPPAAPPGGCWAALHPIHFILCIRRRAEPPWLMPRALLRRASRGSLVQRSCRGWRRDVTTHARGARIELQTDRWRPASGSHRPAPPQRHADNTAPAQTRERRPTGSAAGLGGVPRGRPALSNPPLAVGDAAYAQNV